MRTSSNVAAQGGRKDEKEGIGRRIPVRILQGRPAYPGDHARDPFRGGGMGRSDKCSDILNIPQMENKYWILLRITQE